ncbi:MAG: hypothetical protein IKK60_02230 [Clostridia bacterium]|nr:hypothetical protein [Clostridia bacterium]
MGVITSPSTYGCHLPFQGEAFFILPKGTLASPERRGDCEAVGEVLLKEKVDAEQSER